MLDTLNAGQEEHRDRVAEYVPVIIQKVAVSFRAVPPGQEQIKKVLLLG